MKEMERKIQRGILHCDCNSYFASVEILLNPWLRGKPVAVAGDPASRHGIVVAASQEAKRFGVRTTDTVQQAKQKCPDVVFVKPHHSIYSDYSKKINQIYLQYTDLVDPFSVDESFIDLTGTESFRLGRIVETANEIRHRIREEIGLTISVGVSYNRCFAKLASDMKKPDATTVIFPQDMERVVWPLPVSDLLFVGKRTTEALATMGIRTIGELAEADREFLLERFGKQGDLLWTYANGLDEEPVRSYYAPREVKSISNSFTFPRNLVEEDEIKSGVFVLADSVCSRLRDAGLKGGTLQIQLRDTDFHTISRQKPFPTPTNLVQEVAGEAMNLIHDNWQKGRPIRLISVGCTDLVQEDEAVEQLSFFTQESVKDREKQQKIEDTMAQIRSKMGSDSIRFGITQKKE